MLVIYDSNMHDSGQIPIILELNACYPLPITFRHFFGLVLFSNTTANLVGLKHLSPCTITFCTIKFPHLELRIFNYGPCCQ